MRVVAILALMSLLALLVLAWRVRDVGHLSEDYLEQLHERERREGQR